MFMRKELIIFIIISILMSKIKTSKGRIYEGKNKNHRELNKLHFHDLQTRHYNHYLHKKHHKCNLERSYYRQAHVKKSSRYPTLDKIVHRLDNQIDYLDKIKMATANPFDEWNVTNSPPTTTADKSDFYAYVTVGLKKGNPAKDEHKADEANGESEQAQIKEDNFSIKLGQGNEYDITTESKVYNKGFMQDHTTSSPWENEQHDINSHVEGSSKTPSEGLSTLSTLPSQPPTNSEDEKRDLILDKVPFWSIDQLVPRFTDREDRKKKTTPMPYGKCMNLLSDEFWIKQKQEKFGFANKVISGLDLEGQMPRAAKFYGISFAAHAHYDQILRMGDCHIPKEKVIRVHEVHPDPSKSYSPSCTILHQCGDDTGCCRDLKQVCKPKNTTKVELYFFTTTVGKPQTVEKLHFVNHTECECQKRTDEPLPRDSEFHRNHHKKHIHASSGEAKRKRSNCTCPSKYSARYLQNQSCVCDCFDKQEDCLVLKKGKSHFSYHDKLCIQSGGCLVPSCEFGSYIRQFGRCPNKSEKYHYRWSRILSYRDLIT